MGTTSIDLKFVELTACVLESFFIKYSLLYEDNGKDNRKGWRNKPTQRIWRHIPGMVLNPQ